MNQPTPEQLREIALRVANEEELGKRELLDAAKEGNDNWTDEPIAKVVAGKWGNCLAWIGGDSNDTVPPGTKLYSRKRPKGEQG